MSFDAFMIRACAYELNNMLTGARVEKVVTPSKDEIFLLLHRDSTHMRLLINAGAGAPRLGISRDNPENPKVPPMFCMLLRKHLTGAKISSVKQYGFERLAEITFETYDEMGFFTQRILICEIMGRYSNAILCDAERTVLGVMRPVDFTTSSKRQVLPKMKYEYPPVQDKRNPFAESEEGFTSLITEVSEKAITENYAGFSPLTAREVLHRTKDKNSVLSFWGAFKALICDSESHNYSPCLLRKESGEPYEFSPFEIRQYGERFKIEAYPSIWELTDEFFTQREHLQRERQRAYSTERLMKNAESRLLKKLELQRKELKDTEKKSEFKQKADLITANIYRFKGRAETLTLTDYVLGEDGEYTEREITVKIESGYTPAQYAQKLYKKYNKAKNAERQLTLQIEKGLTELEYVRSVLEALGRIDGQSDLDEIRRELTESGYIKKLEQKLQSKGKKPQKSAPLRSPLKFQTSGGFTVLVGKNNLQNDELTFRTAYKNDFWFHVKNRPGSHTVLLCDGREPSVTDLTEAAILAAKNSTASGDDRAEVDYTRIKNVKKPSGAKPGFVIYENYSTAIVNAKGDL